MFLNELLFFCHSPEGDGGSGPGGSTGGSSGDDDPPDDNPEDDTEDPPPDGKIDYDRHSKVVREARNLRTRLKALETADAKRKTDELKKKGDLESVISQKDDEIQALSTKIGLFEGAVLEGQKESAIRKAVGKALDPKWDRVLNSFINQVKVDDDGAIDAKSVKKLADDFSKEFPEAFAKPRLPDDHPPKGGGDGSITLEQWKAMPNGPEKRAAMSKVLDPE